MVNTTAIAWTEKTWNPVTGCDRVSPGCDSCYALTLAKRLKSMGAARYQNDGDPLTSGPGFGLTVHSDLFRSPLQMKKPAMIFVNSMSDLFHKDVQDTDIAQVFASMQLADWHTFQVLTKRHARMRSLLNKAEFWSLVESYMRSFSKDRTVSPDRFASNIWLGMTVENQKWAEIRTPELAATPAAVRFLSAEPLVGHVDFNKVPKFDEMSWLIVGGESGPRNSIRKMEKSWVDDALASSVAHSVPFFFKQAGVLLADEWSLKGKGENPADWPVNYPREYPV